MFERFLDRVSHSKYKENFVLKGGFLLASIMGSKVRSTMDIDANIYGIDFNENELINIMNEIINIDLQDNTYFDLIKSETIKEDNKYNGYRFKLIGRFFNLKVPFHIDLSTGDIITPMAIEYTYNTILDNDKINIYSYNYETIIAEKLQTILVRANANSRMKDLYDLYYFIEFKFKDINKTILNEAIKRTFKNRNSENLLVNMTSILDIIKEDSTQNKLWNDYSNKFEYANNLKLSHVINTIKKLNEKYK